VTSLRNSPGDQRWSNNGAKSQYCALPFNLNGAFAQILAEAARCIRGYE
jgi:hypothetical protein